MLLLGGSGGSSRAANLLDSGRENGTNAFPVVDNFTNFAPEMVDTKSRLYGDRMCEHRELILFRKKGADDVVPRFSQERVMLSSTAVSFLGVQ